MGARRLLAIAALAAFALTFGPTVVSFPPSSLAALEATSQPRVYLPLVVRQPTPTAYSCNQSQQVLVNGGFENGPLNISPWNVCVAQGCFPPTITAAQASMGAYSALLDTSWDGIEQVAPGMPNWTESAWLKLDFFIESSLTATQNSADSLSIDIFDEATGLAVASAALRNDPQWRGSWYVGRMDVASASSYRGHNLRVRLRAGDIANATRWYVDQVELNFACGPAATLSSGQAGVLDLGAMAGAR